MAEEITNKQQTAADVNSGNGADFAPPKKKKKWHQLFEDGNQWRVYE